MLLLSLDVLMFPGCTGLQLVHPYTLSPGPPELLQFGQPCLPVHCFEVFSGAAFGHVSTYL